MVLVALGSYYNHRRNGNASEYCRAQTSRRVSLSRGHRGQGSPARGPGGKQGILSCRLQVDCSVYRKYPVVAIPCPITYLPVCGSDYITYGNECHLCTESL